MLCDPFKAKISFEKQYGDAVNHRNHLQCQFVFHCILHKAAKMDATRIDSFSITVKNVCCVVRCCAISFALPWKHPVKTCSTPSWIQPPVMNFSIIFISRPGHFFALLNQSKFIVIIFVCSCWLRQAVGILADEAHTEKKKDRISNPNNGRGGKQNKTTTKNTIVETTKITNWLSLMD